MSYITGSQNTDLLDRLTAETAVLDAQLAAKESQTGPHPCCVDLGEVIFCDGEVDTWRCPFGHLWAAPCR